MQNVFIKMKRIFSTKIIQSKGQNSGNTKDGKKSSNSDLCNCLLLKFFNNSQSVFQNTCLLDFELCFTCTFSCKKIRLDHLRQTSMVMSSIKYFNLNFKNGEKQGLPKLLHLGVIHK